MQKLQPWSLFLGAALFGAVFLVLRFSAGLSPSVSLGSEFLMIFIWRLVRAFVGPVATNQYLRKVQILRALPYALYGLAGISDASSTTTQYEPWLFIGGVLLFFFVSRHYVRKLPAEVQESHRRTPGV